MLSARRAGEVHGPAAFADKTRGAKTPGRILKGREALQENASQTLQGKVRTVPKTPSQFSSLGASLPYIFVVISIQPQLHSSVRESHKAW